VALEACEFWLAFADQPQVTVYLGPYLPQLIPILLKGMRYSPDDLTMLKAGVWAVPAGARTRS
jgi:transportin-1